jgi:hypothetical protein
LRDDAIPEGFEAVHPSGRILLHRLLRVQCNFIWQG